MTTRRRIAMIAVATLALMALVAAPCAFASELVPPGIHPKVEAGAGQTVSRGPSAIFYNPANLIYSKFIEPYLDVSFAMVTYTYQHTDTERYEPTTVKMTTPPITAGLNFRPFPRLALGIAYTPMSTGVVTEAANAPIQVSDTYYLANVSTKAEGSKIAGGAAFRFDFPLTLGAGVIYGSERTATLIYRVDEETGDVEENPFVDALYGGSWMQMVGGVRSELLERKLVLALSYKTAVTKAYKGDILIDITGDEDYVTFEGKGYLPATIGLGGEMRFGNLGLLLDFTLEQWSAGRQVYKRGIGTDKDEVDFVDTMNFVGGVKYWLAPKHMLTVAAGMYGANMGNGTVDDTAEASTLQDDAAADPVVGGVQFGDLEAIARMVVSGGYRAKIQGNGFFEAGASYQSGRRVVPEGADGEGTYTLSVITGSVGLAYGF